MRFWIIYILVEVSFLGNCFRAFFFFNFFLSVNHSSRHFYSAPTPPPAPPPIKKLPTALINLSYYTGKFLLGMPIDLGFHFLSYKYFLVYFGYLYFTILVKSIQNNLWDFYPLSVGVFWDRYTTASGLL